MARSDCEVVAGRRALVVGGSRGIGLAVAERLFTDGFQVTTASRGPGELPAHRRVDVCDPIAVESLFGDSFDVVVHAAAIQGVPAAVGPTWATEPGAVAEVVRVNLLGAYHVVSCAVRHCLAARRPGAVLLFSGGGAAGPRPGLTAYAMTKCAVVRLVENVQAELDAADNSPRIRVYAIAPGAVHTAMTDELVAAGDRVPGEAETARAIASGQQGVAAERASALCSYLVGDTEGRLAGRLLHALEDYRGDAKLDPDAGRLRRTPLVSDV